MGEIPQQSKRLPKRTLVDVRMSLYPIMKERVAFGGGRCALDVVVVVRLEKGVKFHVSAQTREEGCLSSETRLAESRIKRYTFEIQDIQECRLEY